MNHTMYIQLLYLHNNIGQSVLCETVLRTITCKARGIENVMDDNIVSELFYLIYLFCYII